MKALIISFLILFSFAGFAQEKFIEVTVSDTAWVWPDCYAYRVSLINEDDEGMTDTLVYSDPAAYKQKKRLKSHLLNKTFDSVTFLVKKAGFRILAPALDDAFLTPGTVVLKNRSIVVITGTIDSLRALYNIISTNTSLQGYVESAFAKDESPYKKRLYKKLLAQAAVNAATIADLSERKAGKILSVTELPEDKNESPGGWTIYPPLSAMANSVLPGWHTTIKGKLLYNFTADEIATTYFIYNTLKVKFALE